ncbi:2OG-Fe(II) oxygenase [Dactylosporangium sp. NPDC000244]|uniref:2OG-Fe(II) oxygenase n=1 Tax=Dactylosporangium sp. NPDC000244 TaxID=3154365 RepID=UPI00332AA7FB
MTGPTDNGYCHCGDSPTSRQREFGEFAGSADERSAINVNVLRTGNGYEWHVDSNPLTGLLFVTDQPAEGGGELVFRADPVTSPGEDWELAVRPRAGELLLFDARRAAHAVMPVRGAADRVSVPMNFYYANAANGRPDCLDRYLYGE